MSAKSARTKPESEFIYKFVDPASNCSQILHEYWIFLKDGADCNDYLKILI